MNAITLIAPADDGIMATPSYRAEMRREAAIREARETCHAAVHAAYVALERAEQAARDAYDSECRAITAMLCDAWEAA